MKKTLTIIIFTLLVSLSVSAQTQDEKDALGVVNKLFEMMAAHNPAEIVALHTPEAQLVAVMKNREGKTVSRNFTAEAFSKNFAEKRGEIKEDMYDPKTEVHGNLALVWGRYVFFVNGKLSHCGVNAFHLVKTDAGWKIAGASSSMDAANCTDAEKARKAE